MLSANLHAASLGHSPRPGLVFVHGLRSDQAGYRERADACARAGRDPATVEIDAIGAAPDAASLASLRGEGVHRAILTVWDEDRDLALRALDRFAAVRDELDGR